MRVARLKRDHLIGVRLVEEVRVMTLLGCI